MEPILPPLDPRSDDIASPDTMEYALLAALDRAGRDLAVRDVPGETADAHLAAIVAAASERAHVVPATAAVRDGSSWATRIRRVAGLTAIKVGLAAGVAAAGTIGLAANDNLPEPVQRVVSDGASWFGVELPHPDAPALPDQADDEAHDQADLPTPPVPADVVPDPVPPATPPHQGWDPDRVPSWVPAPPPFGPGSQSGPPVGQGDQATDGTGRAPVDPPAPMDPSTDETDDAEDRGTQYSGSGSGGPTSPTSSWASVS
jgi:hypothetical protein